MWIPEACTLPTAERPLRVAEFDDLFASTTGPPERPERTLLRLHLPVAAAGTARALAARETECCAFFAFDIQEVADEAVLEVRVPVARTDVLDAIERRADAARTAGE